MNSTKVQIDCISWYQSRSKSSRPPYDTMAIFLIAKTTWHIWQWVTSCSY